MGEAACAVGLGQILITFCYCKRPITTWRGAKTCQYDPSLL